MWVRKVHFCGQLFWLKPLSLPPASRGATGGDALRQHHARFFSWPGLAVAPLSTSNVQGGQTGVEGLGERHLQGSGILQRQNEISMFILKERMKKRAAPFLTSQTWRGTFCFSCISGRGRAVGNQWWRSRINVNTAVPRPCAHLLFLLAQRERLKHCSE